MLKESGRYTAETLSLTRENNGFVKSGTSEELVRTISKIADDKKISQALHMNIFLGRLNNQKHWIVLKMNIEMRELL